MARELTFVGYVQIEEDGRWSAWINELPGCTAWGNTKGEALSELHDAAELYVSDRLSSGETIPESTIIAVDV